MDGKCWQTIGSLSLLGGTLVETDGARVHRYAHAMQSRWREYTSSPYRLTES